MALTLAAVSAVGLLAASSGAQPRVARPRTAPAKTAAAGSVEGDVFLTARSGDVRRVAGSPLWLVPVTAEKLAPARAACRDGAARADSARARFASTKALSDSLSREELRRVADYKTYQAWDQQTRTYRDSVHREAYDLIVAPVTIMRDAAAQGRALLAVATPDRSTETSVDGHFVLSSIAPGDYAAVTHATLGDTDYTLVAPVRVVVGQRTKVNVTNAAAAEGRGDCAQLTELAGGR